MWSDSWLRDWTNLYQWKLKTDRQEFDKMARFKCPLFKLLGMVCFYSAIVTLVIVSHFKTAQVNQRMWWTTIRVSASRTSAITNHHDVRNVSRNRRTKWNQLAYTDQGMTILNETLDYNISKHVIKPEHWLGRKEYITYRDRKPLSKQCSSCAVVNSAGRLIGSKAGGVIDEADCVIRMNGAPTKTYEADVGTRTTFRVMGHRNFPKMMGTMKDRKRYLEDEATRSDIVVIWHYWVDWIQNSPSRWCKTYASMYPNATVYLASEDVMKRNEMIFYKELNVSKSIVKVWMSTGWGTMLFALDVCETIEVYGMIYEDFCSKHPNDTHPYHYFDNLRTECAYYAKSEKGTHVGHKFLTEKAVFAKWAAAYGIVFHEPSWDGQLKGFDENTVVDTLFKRTFKEYEQRQSGRGDRQPLISVKRVARRIHKPAAHDKILRGP